VCDEPAHRVRQRVHRNSWSRGRNLQDISLRSPVQLNLIFSSRLHAETRVDKQKNVFPGLNFRMVHFTHMLVKASPTCLGTTKIHLAALGLAAARADMRRPAALAAPARVLRAMVTVMRGLPRTQLQRGGQVDANAEAQWRNPTVS